ncbi:MAG: glycosyltransferase family 4 protein [Isosphaeraceae bacterium]
MRRTKVFFVCPGLGHVARGYETFTREAFDALRGDDRLDAALFKGAGPAADRERALWCLRRNQLVARWLGASVFRDGYYMECATFALSLLSHLARQRPDVVYYSDGTVGNLLWRWRRLTNWPYKLLLCNGGQLGPPAFPRIDHVQQVLAVDYEESIRAGRPAGDMTLLPLGFRIDPDFTPLTPSGLARLRTRLGLPVGRPIVLTVGVIDRSIKRMDYVVREVAALGSPRPFLLMLGQRGHESPGVLELADELLGPTGYRCQTVSADSVRDYYDASDAFVLGSPREGFGRVLVEALARGLPCLATDRPFARLVLGEHGYYADFDQPGELTRLLEMVLAEEMASGRAAIRHAAAYDSYSWDRLRPQYVNMIERCAGESVEATYGRDLSARASAAGLPGLDGRKLSRLRMIPHKIVPADPDC